MVVRGWLIVGDGKATAGLPPERSLGMFIGPLPNAAEHRPGQWFTWVATPDFPYVCVVCVDVPVP